MTKPILQFIAVSNEKCPYEIICSYQYGTQLQCTKRSMRECDILERYHDDDVKTDIEARRA